MLRRRKNTFYKRPSITLGAVLISGAAARNVQAQDKQENDKQERVAQREQQRSQATRSDRSDLMDQAVESLLVIKLAARPGLNEVNVEVRDGVATLSGKVASQQAEQRALRSANSTMGVITVRDQISVDKSLGDKRQANVGAKDLAKQVVQKIAGELDRAKAGEDWWFEGWRIEGPYNRWNMVVEVDEPGRVVLDGEVPSLELARKAVEAARKVPGVRAVDSDLEVERYYYGYPGYGYPYRYGYDPYYGESRSYPYVAPPQDVAPPQARAGREKHDSKNLKWR